MSASTPDHLKALLSRMDADISPTFGAGGRVAAFVRICDLLEPNLSPMSLSMDFPDWAANLEEARAWTTDWSHNGRVTEPFERKRLERLYEIAVHAWAPSATVVGRQLSFMKDSVLRFYAERDYSLLLDAEHRRLVRLVLVLAGTVTEALLLDVVEREGKGRYSPLLTPAQHKKLDSRDPATWDLVDLIDVAGPKGLGALSAEAVDYAQKARMLRNDVHPGRERKTQEEAGVATFATAMIAHGFVEKAFEEIGQRYS